MGEVIYWKEYDEPKKVVDFLSKKEMEVKGTWVCNDERVDWVAVIGSIRAKDTSKAVIGLEMLMKDGTRYSSSMDASNEVPLDEIIYKAEKYLEELNKQSK